MKPKTLSSLSFFTKTLNVGKENIKSIYLKEKFRKLEKYFTRNRKLTFENMITLILLKGVKSLQLRLNEFSNVLSNKLDTITVSAYVQAKNKLSYFVFVHLNLAVIINRYYDLNENEAGYETWNNFRLLATDGSQIRLPDEKEIKEKYGKTKIKNGYLENGEYTHGLLSVLYDPLNNLALDTILEKGDYSERALAIQNIFNLEKTINIKEKDLIIYDRGYYSGFLFAILLAYNKEFLCRMKRGNCTDAKELFEKDCKINSKIIILKVNNKEDEYEKKYGIKLTKKISKTIKIRLVRIILSTGEIEVLATSLLREDKYKIEKFKDLYFKRWGIEVYYDVLKNRLGLENFSGKNNESVLQDLHSCIFLSNFETIATRACNLELEQKSKKKKLKNKQKVNKQVSFNIIKNKVIDLFLSNRDLSEIIQEMGLIFTTNVTQERLGRTNSRNKTTPVRSLNYHKRKKKSCF